MINRDRRERYNAKLVSVGCRLCLRIVRLKDQLGKTIGRFVG